jgi:hypothetical protein
VTRSLMLTLVLSLGAVLLVPTSSIAQSTAFTRADPVQVTATTTPRRDRFRPYTFTTRGSVIPPSTYCAPGVDPRPGAGNCIPILCPPGATDPRYCLLPSRSAIICAGIVTVRFQKGSATISARNVFLRPDCTYASRVSFRTRARTRRGAFKVKALFQGNLVLNPKNSSTQTVLAG